MGKIIQLNTPIGNLGDLTKRVEDALKSGTLFAVEDTRVFKELLNHLGISLNGKHIYSLHDQSEQGQLKKLLELARVNDLYVASEAGSPIVSDPAYPLIRLAYEQGFQIDSYSGVSSPIMALELAGLPPLPFTFHGFLPREKSKKQSLFLECGVGTHIFFEAPTRISDTLDELMEVLPQVDVAIVRELSKKFQEVLRFKALDWPLYREKLMNKGEFILLFRSNEEKPIMGHGLKEMAQNILDEGATPKLVSKLLADILGRSTKDVYGEISRHKK